MQHFVYSLVDPRDGAIRYIGITNNTDRRYKDHCRCTPFGGVIKNAWISDMKQANVLPEMKVLEVVENKETARERELYWIKHYKPLANTQDILNTVQNILSQSNKLSLLGEQIDAARQRHGLSAYQVAKNAGMDYAQLYRTMRNTITPKRETLLRICRAMRCSHEEASEILKSAGYYLSPDDDEERPSKPAA